jgi:hypothetical protein
MTGQETVARMHAAFDAAHLSLDELWLRYFAFGGTAGRVEIDAYLQGLLSLSPVQHDMLAHALNERLDDI